MRLLIVAAITLAVASMCTARFSTVSVPRLKLAMPNTPRHSGPIMRPMRSLASSEIPRFVRLLSTRDCSGPVEGRSPMCLPEIESRHENPHARIMLGFNERKNRDYSCTKKPEEYALP